MMKVAAAISDAISTSSSRSRMRRNISPPREGADHEKIGALNLPRHGRACPGHPRLVHDNTVILRSRAFARRLEGWPQTRLWPSFEARPLAGEHLRMTAEFS